MKLKLHILLPFIIYLVLVTSHYYCQESSYWNDLGEKTLNENINKKINENTAKNVILFIGDGMGMSTITAGRILKGQREGKLGEDASLTFDKFPFVGVSKTYNTDKTVTDSAAAATAFLCGFKTKYNAVGVDDNIKTGDCSTVERSRRSCIAEWALDSGKSVGVVTNTRVTHATPAPLYSAAAIRYWESDVPEKDRGKCLDIATQLVHKYPGKNLQVILGGGRAKFIPNNKTDHEYKERTGDRVDGVDLIDDWIQKRKNENVTYSYVWNKNQFDKVDPNSTDFLLGLFELSHMKDVTEVDRNSEIQKPTLENMTEKAIQILSKNRRGYFLLVEGGLIDHLHHQNLAVRAISEMVAFDDAVSKALQLTRTDETLIIVTGDHSQSMMLGGYPSRGDDIFGAHTISNVDNMPFTTLLYSSGPGYNNSYPNGRQNLTGVNTASKDYVYQAAVPRSSATHVGEDVTSYSIGPMAHLLQGVYEQNYIAHMMAYTLKIGSYRKNSTLRNVERSSIGERSGTLSSCATAQVAGLSLLDRGPRFRISSFGSAERIY